MSSPRFSFNTHDLRSAVRHTVAPVLAGAALAGWQVVEQGLQAGQWAVEWSQVAVAAKVAALAGVGRLVHRWMTEITPPQQ